VAAVLIIATVGVTLLLDGEEDGPASESSECDQPAETTWTRLVGPDATASATVVAADGSFDFVVTDAHFRLLGEGIYEVVLQTVMTNNTPVQVAHGDWRYDHLEVNRFPFPEQTCFSAIQTVLNEEQSSRAMLGFEVTEEPGGQLRLIVEEADDQAIIDLDSSG
jgi:hypothetical protein